MKFLNNKRVTVFLLLLLIFEVVIFSPKIFSWSKSSETYSVSLYGKIHQEKWIRKESVTSFFFNTTSVGSLAMKKNGQLYEGVIFSSGNKYVFVFPKAPSEMKDGEQVRGTLFATFELDDETLSQPATFKKIFRASDGKVVLQLLSGSESSLFVYLAVWLYKESEDGYLLPDQMFQVARRKYEDGIYIMEAIAKERTFKHLQLPIKVSERH